MEISVELDLRSRWTERTFLLMGFVSGTQLTADSLVTGATPSVQMI